MNYQHLSDYSSDGDTGDSVELVAKKKKTTKRLRDATRRLMDNIIVWQIVAVVVLVAALLVFEELNRKTATLTIDIDGEKRTFQGEIVEGMTMLDALNASVLAGGIKLQFAIEDNGAKILEFDGYVSEEANSDVYFYLNSEVMSIYEINKAFLRKDDHVLVRVVPSD
jgi:hypothetical protein